MGISGGPYIVRDSSLVLELDAADQNSYSGSGTVWTALTTNSYSGSLVNGPTFSSGNGGAIVFDGVNDYISTNITKTIIPTISDVTFASWIYPTNNGINDEWIILSNLSINSPNYHNVAVGRFTDNKFYFNNFDGTEHRCYADIASLNTWVYVVGVRSNNNNYIYLNGSIQSQVIASGTPNIASSTTLRIGGGADYSKGNISNTQIYNRALSSTEILQNYNAQKSRFGL
jgi:hypothetical protein